MSVGDGRIDASRPAESIHASIFLRPCCCAVRKEQWQPSRARLAFESDQQVQRVKCSQRVGYWRSPPLPRSLISLDSKCIFADRSFRPTFLSIRCDRRNGEWFSMNSIHEDIKECKRVQEGREIYALKDFYRNLDLGCVNACGETGNSANFIFSLINSMSLSVGAAKTDIKRREACIISDARASFTNDLSVDFYARRLDFEPYFRYRWRLYLKTFPNQVWILLLSSGTYNYRKSPLTTLSSLYDQKERKITRSDIYIYIYKSGFHQRNNIFLAHL